MKTIEARTAEQWRKWLAKHHDCESEVWLVFHKRHTGRPSISHHDAVDQALRFGWVDSLIKRLDEERYARKFTPRKPDSRWSDLNRKRYARLKANCQLMPAGVARAPANRTYDAHCPLPRIVPDYIRKALKECPPASDCFESLPPSHRRRYIGWIHFAKLEATKTRRLKEAIRLLAKGKKLGLK